jgi:hypothetical protein
LIVRAWLARRSLRTNIDKADRAPQGMEKGDGDPDTE